MGTASQSQLCPPLTAPTKMLKAQSLISITVAQLLLLAKAQSPGLPLSTRNPLGPPMAVLVPPMVIPDTYFLDLNRPIKNPDKAVPCQYPPTRRLDTMILHRPHSDIVAAGQALVPSHPCTPEWQYAKTEAVLVQRVTDYIAGSGEKFMVHSVMYLESFVIEKKVIKLKFFSRAQNILGLRFFVIADHWVRLYQFWNGNLLNIYIFTSIF